MCEPTTVFMGISLALTAIGGYTQYESQKAEGRYNEAVAKNNAAAAETQAQQAEQLGSIEEDRQRARMRQMIGKQRTAFAANNIDSIAFPAISCGAYGFPIDDAADIALDTIQSFLDKHGKPKEVFVVCFQPQVKFAFAQVMSSLG